MKNLFVVLKNEERVWLDAIDKVNDDDFIIFISVPGPNNSKEAQDKAIALVKKNKAHLEYGKLAFKTDDDNLALVDKVVQYHEEKIIAFDAVTKKKIAAQVIESIEHKGNKMETTVYLIGQARNVYSGDLLKAYNRQIRPNMNKALKDAYGLETSETQSGRQEKPETKIQETEEQPKDKKRMPASGRMRMQSHTLDSNRHATPAKKTNQSSSPKQNPPETFNHRDKKQQEQHKRQERADNSCTNPSNTVKFPNEEQPDRQERAKIPQEEIKEADFVADISFEELPFPLLPQSENLFEGDHKKLDTFLLGHSSDRTPEIKSAENLLMLRYLERFRDIFFNLLEDNPIEVELYIRDWHRIIDLAYRAEDAVDFSESVSTLYNAVRLPIIKPETYRKIKYHAQRYIEICSIVYQQIDRTDE